MVEGIPGTSSAALVRTHAAHRLAWSLADWRVSLFAAFVEGRENEKAFSKGVTKDGAKDLLTQDTAVAERAVNEKVAARGAILTQNQFDALVSFTYNVGTGNLEKVLAGAVGKDGKLDLDAIPGRMRLYEKSSGRILLGLTRRRNREAELFLKK